MVPLPFPREELEMDSFLLLSKPVPYVNREGDTEGFVFGMTEKGPPLRAGLFNREEEPVIS
jgi:hypothetical protein